jgi:N-acetylated-alpha-linked acidic dipeptidase
VLLFDEASSDGSERGPVWPNGAWKPEWEAQRGSISPMGRIPGDPSTPGWPSPKPGTSNARRISGDELAASLPRIPCLPIGSNEAQMLLTRLAEVDAKDADGNSKPQKLGPGPVQVRLALDMPRELRTIVSVIGRLKGASDDVVIAGAHRDAWVRGANDDGAGTVAMLRAAAHLGEKARAGSRPASTILLCFWDAEEFGLIGSTEWAEANADWLREHCIAYVNADVGVHGTKFRGATGSPGMLGTLERVLRTLPSVSRASETTASPAAATLWDEWVEAAGENGPHFSLPGSGSDFAAFVHHLNLPMLEVGLGGAAGGQYHTTFDDFVQVDRYIDPGFVGHEALGHVFDALLTELARAGRSSFDASEAAREIARLARAAGAEEGGWLGAERAERLALCMEELASAPDAVAEGRFYAALSVEGGVPNRPWYRNPLWTPGLEDGYGSETFPTLRAAALSGADALDAELTRLVESVRALRPKD